MIITYSLALLLEDISIILGVVGAVATVPITLTLPGLYLARLSSSSSSSSGSGGGGSSVDSILGWSCFFLGIFLCGFCLYGTLAGAV